MQNGYDINKIFPNKAIEIIEEENTPHEIGIDSLPYAVFYPEYNLDGAERNYFPALIDDGKIIYSRSFFDQLCDKPINFR